METLSNLVRSLAIIIILAGLLEMFLPSNNLKPSVQVIIGLFILVTILNPLLGLINKEWTTELQAWTTEGMGVSLDQVLAKGDQIRQNNQTKAMDQYRQKLAAQVTGLANLVPGIQVRNARVEVNGEGGLPGKVDKIQLTVAPVGKTKTPSDGTSSLVKPVEINLEETRGSGVQGLKVTGNVEAESSRSENTAVPVQSIKQLKSTLANIYGIRPEAVEINEFKEGKSSVR